MPVNLESVDINFCLLLVIIILIIFCLYLCYSCGYLSSIEVKIQKSPYEQIDVAYKFVTGPYSKCKKLLLEVQRLAPYLDSFVIYQEDPRKYTGSIRYPFMEGSFFNPSHPLLSGEVISFTVGAIIRVNKQLCNKYLCQILKKNGYSISCFPPMDQVLMAAFPFVNRLSLYSAIKQIYPKMRNIVEVKRLCAYPVIEIYTYNKLYFLVPLSHQTDFFVPEAHPEYIASDSDSCSEGFTPIYYSRTNSVQHQASVEKFGTSLANQMLKKHCMCDNDRSQSCDYCKRNL